MANHRATHMLHPYGRGINNNLASLAYRPHIAAPKSFDGTFRTHVDLVSKIRPVMTAGEWVKLPNGGSRDSNIEKWLAVIDRAKLYCHPVESDEPGYWRASKKSIVLCTELAGGAWLISIPLADAAAELEDETVSSPTA